MKKRILTLVMAVALCFGFVTVAPLPANAATDNSFWQWSFDSSNIRITDVAHYAGKYWCHTGGHLGYDMVPKNTDWSVKPIADGKVVEVSNKDTMPYGVFIVISHNFNGKTYYSKYQHLALNSIAVKVSDTVSKDTKIATMGNTGDSDGAHLHVELGYKNNGNGALSELVALERYLPLLNRSCYNEDGLDWAYVNDSAAKKPPNYVEWGFAKQESTQQSQFFIAKPENGKSTVPVRQENNSNGKELYTIDKGVPVLTVGSAVNTSGNTWYKTPDGGWIYSERLAPVGTAAFKTYTAKTMFIVKDGAPVRYSPYQESKKVSSIIYLDKISVIGEFTNARNNKWYIDSQGHWIFSGNVSDASPVAGQWLFHNGSNTDVYLNASDDKNGGNVTVKPRDNSAWQTFSITTVGGNHRITVTGSKNGRVVNVSTEGTSSTGHKITLWTPENNLTQLWTLEYKDKAYIIRPADNSKVALTAYSDGSVKLAANSGAKEQLWYLETPRTATAKPVAYAPEYDEGENAPPIPEETPAPTIPTTPTTPSSGADFSGIIVDGNSDIWFDYEVKQDGYYTYSYTADNWEVSGLFYSNDGKNEIWFIQEHPQESLVYNELTKQYEATGGVYLHKGNYKFRFVPYSWYVGTGPQNTRVSLSIKLSSAKYGVDNEPNDTSANAINLPTSGTLSGYLGGYRNDGSRDIRDWMTFAVPSAGDYSLRTVSDQSCYMTVVVYDGNGNHIDTKFPQWAEFTNSYELSEPISLPSAGQYYIELKLDDERAGNGNYKLTVSGVSPVAAVSNLGSAASWAHDGITSAVSKGFVPSDLQNNYSNTITRQEFCRMAAKWLEYKTGKSIDTILSEQGKTRNPNAFSDTSDPDILAAFALSITNGTVAPTADKSGTFTPNGNFTREQAATMIRNTCKAAGMDVSNITDASFTDISTASSWAVDGINFVRNAGIMGGTSTTVLVFSPKGICSRQESIVIFDRIP